ncbi:GntR family transcriptional regulator [Paenibacillus psychroresistens]|uniref:GntR family transcriptional regulator n=1 Tax=Paenibacillus psychroresistens TaxID=1778678 RepID=A0A6B8RVA1_9BACL|nr:GntR family transcriptional regulator [Paenibacillus psychroresistens]QGQ99694.1 GntR family transcriptional regulator [Paenibacillus psychroresistens]
MNRKIPLYNQIQKFILDQIQAGVWKPHDQLPAERILADQFKVSRITAKNAVVGLVAEGYLYRHRGKGTFVTDKKISLSSPTFENTLLVKSAPKIGLIMPWMEFRYQFLLISGIEFELSRRGYHLVFKRIDDSDNLGASTIKELLSIPIDGLVVVASRGEYFQDDMLRLILEKFPLVFVEKYFRDFKVNGVHCDTEKVGYLMGQYLVSRKKQQIGYISYPSHYTVGVRERLFGFQSALLEYGVPPLPAHLNLTVSPEVLQGLNQIGPHPVPEEILNFIKDHPDLEAIAAADAHIAQFIGRACWQLGRHDIIIISCDEPSLAPECIMPAAYVDQSPAEIGIIAAQLMVNSIEQDSDTVLTRVEPRLIELYN